MNILFLSLGEFHNLDVSSVHIDLVKQLAAMGHQVYVACKSEKRLGVETHLIENQGLNILKIKTGNIKNTNLLEKGLSTILLENQFLAAIKKYLYNVKFDLVLYHTPPITFGKVIKYIKKRDQAKSYLLLKDIFPQNSVDLGMFSQKSPIYFFFRKKEKQLYAVSDKIGCMSKANVEYVLKHNPEINPKDVEICPNSIIVKNTAITQEERLSIREKYRLPLDKKIFVYGGNLGKPQGIPFILSCLNACADITAVQFLIVGGGTEYNKLKAELCEKKYQNVTLMSNLPSEEYEKLVKACDVGLIFLDYRFTIPNYPSRLLSYLQAKMPVLCATDVNTDVGDDVEKGNMGWKCYSNDPMAFKKQVLKICQDNIKNKGENAFKYLQDYFDVKLAADIIINSLKN